MIRTAFRLAAPVVALVAGASLAHAQMSPADLLMRIDQLEAQVRQLTGSVEQLQYRNQQLEQALRDLQGGQEAGQRGAARSAAPPRAAQAAPQAPYQPPSQAQPQYQPPQQYPQQAQYPQQSQYPQQPQYQPPPAAPAPGRRSDAFDPSQNPSAPGAPRVLGSMSSGGQEGAALPPPANEAPVGAPGGRNAGAPLDLSTMAANAANGGQGVPPEDGALPPPPPRNPNATGGRLATLPPAQSPRDEYDLAYGFILRKDYAQAEEGFRAFLGKYPNDRLSPDAQYWLGESLFQRQNYRDAADAFLNMSKKYEASPKAAEALLRLAQSLAGLNEKELACATLGEVGRKYPRASTSIKQAIEREQKRVRC